jgi:DnaJ-class molecular chaperone
MRRASRSDRSKLAFTIVGESLMSQQGGNQGSGTNPGDEATPGTPGTGEDICPVCHGTGKVSGADCKNCGGTGKIVEGIGGA